MRRWWLACSNGLILAMALFMVAPVPAAAIGLNPVTVDCGDGAPIHANVDLQELTKLTGVMQAMAADSSEGGCNLNHDSQGEERETHPFVVGAGVYGMPVGCPLSFKLKASVGEEGGAHGFQLVNAPPDNCGTGPGRGRLRANVVCLVVQGKVAEMRGIVSESTGPLFATYLGIKPGDVLFSDVQENPPGIPDEIFQDKGAPGSENACVAAIDHTAAFPLDRGDIDVHE